MKNIDLCKKLSMLKNLYYSFSLFWILSVLENHQYWPINSQSLSNLIDVVSFIILEIPMVSINRVTLCILEIHYSNFLKNDITLSMISVYCICINIFMDILLQCWHVEWRPDKQSDARQGAEWRMRTSIGNTNHRGVSPTWRGSRPIIIFF